MCEEGWVTQVEVPVRSRRDRDSCLRVDGTASGWTAADLAPSARRVCSHLASGGFGESCRGQVR